MPYIKYTDEQKQQANHYDLVMLLKSRGEKLKREGHEYRWISGHDSITIRENEWYQHSTGQGGYPVNFCMKFLEMTYQQTMDFLLGGSIDYDYKEFYKPEKKEFELPVANGNMRRVYAYLTKQRGIAPEVITEFVHQRKIYEDAKYHNIVFVGKDENVTPAWASKRSTNSQGKTYRGNVAGSDKRCSFNHTGGGNMLFIFEAPIDMMSYITIYPTDWKEQNYISLDGVADKPLLHFLSHNPHITVAYLCLDNDRAGLEANERIGKTLADMGLRVDMLVPEQKDWNQDNLLEVVRCQQLKLSQ